MLCKKQFFRKLLSYKILFIFENFFEAKIYLKNKILYLQLCFLFHKSTNNDSTIRCTIEPEPKYPCNDSQFLSLFSNSPKLYHHLASRKQKKMTLFRSKQKNFI